MALAAVWLVTAASAGPKGAGGGAGALRWSAMAVPVVGYSFTRFPRPARQPVIALVGRPRADP